MLSLLSAAALVLAERQTTRVIAAAVGVIAQSLAAGAADLRAGIEAIRRLEGIGEDVVVARALQHRVGLVFLLGNDELFGVVKAGHEQVAYLKRRVAACQHRDINAADLAQLL